MFVIRNSPIVATCVFSCILLASCSFSDEEYRGLAEELFRDADLNKDGELDWEEYAQSEKKSEEIPTREDFADFDQNRDGSISKDEFIQWWVTS